MSEEIKENSDAHAHRRKSSIVKCVRDNPWIISSFVLGILVLIMIVSSFGGLTGKVVSEKKASEAVQSYFSDVGVDVDVNSVKRESGVYFMEVSTSSGQSGIITLSLDGKYLGELSLLPEEKENSNTNSNSNTQEIPKSEKPVVELFVMSHCPYGTQAEKGILPVVNLLGDKINFDVKFVYYAMHPSAGEVEEQLNQYCIQKEQESKYNDYLECFLEEGDGESCLTEAGIDKSKMNSCVSATDKQYNVLANKNDQSKWLNGRYPLFNIYKELNEQYGVGGSPTLVINGQQVSAGRSPSAYLDAICSSFSDGNVPEECGETLPSESYSPGFGWTLSSGTATNGAQCY